PLNMQNYNRYSYVLNNPMSYTDPSGYNFVKKALKGVMEATGTRKVLRELGRNQYLNAAVQIGVCIAGGPVACGAYAGAQSFAMTGSLGAGLRSGLITFGTAWTFQQIGGSYSDLSAANVDNVVFNGAQLGSYLDFGGNLLTAGQVAGQIFSHAMVGGVSASLQGGKFGHGFFSAGVTKGLGTPLMDASFAQNVVGGTVISATIGGTASVIAGGKFANGAVTGAMQALYNYYGPGFGNTDDKPWVEVDELKLTLSVEAGPLRLLSLDSNGDINTLAISYDYGPVQLDISRGGINPALGSSSLNIAADGTLNVKLCSHARGGGCGAVSVRGSSPKLNTATNNVIRATTPYQTTQGHQRVWLFDKLCPNCNLGI
ncbi:hypothetical protein SAMN04488051_108151, partial [Alkalimonas amylolytica]